MLALYVNGKNTGIQEYNRAVQVKIFKNINL